MRTPFLSLMLVAAIAFLLPRDSWPQQAEAIHRIGVLVPGKPLAPGAAPPPSELFRVFKETLASQGYLEGKNLAIDRRFDDYKNLPALARELERQQVEVILVIGTEAARIVQEVVKRTPLVIYSCDPYEHVTKLSRPEGNVTGTTCMTTELSPKRLELLKELLPGARRVVFFGDPKDAPLGWQLTREAAPKLGIALQMVPYKDREDIPAVLEKIAQIKPDAVYVYPDPINGAEADTLARFWLEHSLPSMNAFPFYADFGGLMSYGAINTEIGAMIGRQVAKILDGMRPGDIPVQRATQFHLVINLKTAKALGVRVPQSLRIRADRVIE